jgi:DNA-directed RNA polymerase specialized sigma24 family protein
MAAETADVLDRQRDALALVQYGELNYRDVADVMGVPAGEVAQYLGASLRHEVSR